MGQRTWIKIYCEKWLMGTLREETAELRGVWVDLLALAGNSTYGDIGKICLPNNVPLNDAQLGAILCVNGETWNRAKSRLIKTERIIVNEVGVIAIKKWQLYQSEYDRQKPQRRKKVRRRVHRKVQPKVRGEGEGEREGEGDKKEKDKNPFVELFNSTCPNLPKISSVSKSRLQKIAIRLKENPDLSWWKSVFEKANRVVIAGKAGQKDWKPSFDWLIENDKNALKVIEGNYDEHRLTWRDKQGD